jgi:putative tryptophan/tyrosine transport system substrate-binding protein
MRRREFIGITLSALALPSAVRAQKAIPLIGWLSGNVASSEEAAQKAFNSGLSELGYEVGRNVRVEYRYANGKYDQLQTLADELVGLHVNAVVSVSSYPVVLAAKKATSTIPIIFFTGVDPVRFGLVQSMNKPGGNLTGVAVLSNELAAKRIELFHELLPTTVPIAVLVNSANTPTEDDLKHAEETIRKLGREFTLVQASNKSEIETAFATVAEKKAALFVWDEAYFATERALIVSLAERHSVPCIYGPRRSAEIGGLISYGANLLGMMRMLGNYTGKVLRGTLPADLPVMQPTKYELVINLKTAKALGLEIPAALLAGADEVIE